MGARARVSARRRQAGDGKQRIKSIGDAVWALKAACCGDNFEHQPLFVPVRSFWLRLQLKLGGPVARSTMYAYLQNLIAAGVCIRRYGQVCYVALVTPDARLEGPARVDESPRRWTTISNRIAKSTKSIQKNGSPDNFSLSMAGQGDGMDNAQPRPSRRGMHNAQGANRINGRFAKAAPPTPPTIPTADGVRQHVAAAGTAVDDAVHKGSPNGFAEKKENLLKKRPPQADSPSPPVARAAILGEQADSSREDAPMPDPFPPSGMSWPQVAEAVDAGRLPFDAEAWLSPAHHAASASLSNLGRFGAELLVSAERVAFATAIGEMYAGRPPWSELAERAAQDAKARAEADEQRRRAEVRAAREAQRQQNRFEPPDVQRDDDAQQADAAWLERALAPSKHLAGLQFFLRCDPGITRGIVRMAVGRLVGRNPARVNNPHAYVAKTAREMLADGQVLDPRVQPLTSVWPDWDDAMIAFAGMRRDQSVSTKAHPPDA